MAKNNKGKELWWLGIVEGIVAILFGVAALFWPGLTLATLVVIFSAYILVWGVASIISGVLNIGSRSDWWLTLIFGLVGLGVGVYLVRHPHVSFATMILLIGFTLILRGLIDIVGSLISDESNSYKTLSVIVGVAAIIAGVVVLNAPVASGIAFVWILGLYALIFGPFIIAQSFDIKHQLES